MEQEEEVFFKQKVTYYVGRMYAAGGILLLRQNDLLFSPQSALDRAMGATEVSIPLADITGIEVKGTIIKTLYIQTGSVAHRFVGSELDALKERMELLRKHVADPAGRPAAVIAPPVHEIPAEDLEPATARAHGQCPVCAAAVRATFNFCPFCAARLTQILCAHCHERLEPGWKSCSRCGTPVPAS